ncbi:copper chaperone PCu(A)C [Sulfurimonas sp. HSL1-2]|uniref:copper chaperone PCu(A)C n=1 Tax=Thiomicrolovo zhangzhouensis TaxID=3131933 RepID=UPI0031F7929F
MKLLNTLLFTSLFFIAGLSAHSIEVSGIYVREVPPNLPNSAAFMELKNPTDKPVALVSAASTAAKTVELHEHVNVDGMMQMRQIPKIDIPAGGTTMLQPGGLHVMLIGLTQKLKAGENVTITLNFSDGESITLEAPVKKVAGMMMQQKMKCGSGKCGK